MFGLVGLILHFCNLLFVVCLLSRLEFNPDEKELKYLFFAINLLPEEMLSLMNGINILRQRLNSPRRFEMIPAIRI